MEFHPEAEEEMNAAAAFYGSDSATLAVDFLAAVEAATRRIAEHPNAGSPMRRGRRRVLVRRFPYAVVYRVLDTQRVRVTAVMHLRRRPGYWRHRDSR